MFGYDLSLWAMAIFTAIVVTSPLSIAVFVRWQTHRQQRARVLARIAPVSTVTSFGPLDDESIDEDYERAMEMANEIRFMRMHGNCLD